MVAINAAYAVLSDAKSRATYDAFLANLGRPAPAPDDVQSRVKPVSARPPAGPASPVSATRKKQFPKVVFAAVLLAAVGLLVLRESTLLRREPVRVLAERGDIPSQLAMGWNSLVPQNGQKKDIDQAIAWFQKAALQGNAEAQYQLGGIYIFSLSERHDDTLGKAWLLKAAELGHVQAKIDLGVHYLYGRPPDREAAIVWLERAAVSGSKKAQLTLGIAYDTGNLKTDDLVKAYRLRPTAAFWKLNSYAFPTGQRSFVAVNNEPEAVDGTSRKRTSTK